MPYAQRLHGGWYETLQQRPQGLLRRTVYLFVVPDVGPFITDDVGAFVPIPPAARAWEWHGPYGTPRAARTADLAHDAPLPQPLDDE